jgi:hypothetical protein
MLVVLYVVLAGIVSILVYLFVRSRPAYQQPRDTVVIREPGKRLLGKPQSLATEGPIDLQFAWLSQIAYEEIHPEERIHREGDCPDPNLALREAGWIPWHGFPDRALEQIIAKVHLRAQVWVNPSRRKVAVTFGGTVFRNREDWKANLRWFIPFHDDEYTEIVKVFNCRFAHEFLKRGEDSTWAFLDDAEIYSTGHSLGGGLAQEFAYSWPTTMAVPRVKKVFAFDPTPVTGFFSVDKATRNENKQGLKIDRIYSRGEILAILRSFTSVFVIPSAVNPSIRQLRYNLFGGNIVTRHSISKLACELNKVLHHPTSSSV